MSLLGDIAKVALGPIGGLIDGIAGNGEKKIELQTKLAEAQTVLEQAALEYEGKLAEARASVIRAEAAGNWLQRSWRPIVMLTFAGIVLYGAVAPTLGAPPIDFTGVPDRFWTLLTVGIGGYVAGRTVEKVLPQSKWSKPS